jgi:CDP-diacylglycerol pyrophosphatase
LGPSPGLRAHEASTTESGLLGDDPTYVVLHGDPVTNHNFLLVPSCRISGIECPFISTLSAPNYWLEAWTNAHPSGAAPVIYPNIGLGINSASPMYRQQEQLHIHMAGILSGVQAQLNNFDSVITNNPANWGNQIVPVAGLDNGMPAPRSYRALRVPNLNQNLFRTLRNNVVPQAEMAKQTMIVARRHMGSGGFYVLNSQPDLVISPGQPHGTGTADLLLVYS